MHFFLIFVFFQVIVRPVEERLYFSLCMCVFVCVCVVGGEVGTVVSEGEYGKLGHVPICDLEEGPYHWLQARQLLWRWGSFLLEGSQHQPACLLPVVLKGTSGPARAQGFPAPFCL